MADRFVAWTGKPERMAHRPAGAAAGALALLVCGPSAIAQEADELLERGTYLMESIGACGNCHTPKTADGAPIENLHLAGGFVIEEPGLKAYAPNITMDVETGIGSWSNADIIRAIREGFRPDGTLIGPPMPTPWYRDISDTDVRAIVAYLRAAEPVNRVVPKSEYRVPLPPNWGPPVVSVPDVSRDDPLAYGTYVAVALGHCTECHTPLVEGQHDFSRTGLGGNSYPNIFGLGFAVISANVTPHPSLGIGEWTDDDVKRAITEGVRPDGRQMLDSMAFQYYRNMADEDLDALVDYLRSLPPQPAE